MPVAVARVVACSAARPPPPEAASCVHHRTRLDRGNHATAQRGACGKHCEECFHGCINAGLSAAQETATWLPRFADALQRCHNLLHIQVDSPARRISPCPWHAFWRRCVRRIRLRRSRSRRKSRSASSTTSPARSPAAARSRRRSAPRRRSTTVNEQGGVMGYKINAIFADAQSKVDVAINEMTRLIDQEKVDIVCRRLLERAVRADGAADRLAQEVPVAERVHRHRGVQGQEAPLRVPAAGAQRPVRRLVLRLHQLLRQVQVRHRAEEHAHRDHPRGRPVRRRRRRGQRGAVQEARHEHRAEGGLLGDRAGSLQPGDEAEARAARRAAAYRLQPGHHAVPAPGQGAGLQGEGDDRPRRRPQPDRQAAPDLRRRRQLLPLGRPGRGAAARPEDAEARRVPS